MGLFGRGRLDNRACGRHMSFEESFLSGAGLLERLPDTPAGAPNAASSTSEIRESCLLRPVPLGTQVAPNGFRDRLSCPMVNM
jgi:hypothetical protein